MLNILRNAETTQNEIARLLHQWHGKEDAMQKLERVRQGDAVIPGLVSDAGLLDLRSLVSDITPETSASGGLTQVNAAFLLVSVIRSLPYRSQRTARFR